MSLQHYNSQDLEVRTAIAACAIGCMGASLAKRKRFGSATYCEMSKFAIAVEQLNIIRTFDILELQSTSTITILTDGGTDVGTTVEINGTTVSNPVLFTNSPEDTAVLVADAINNFTSTPDYKATAVGKSVKITSVEPGYFSNGYQVTLNGGDFTATLPFLTGGQDGVKPEDNIITEAELENMFSGISELTGCCYAPLGYAYEDPKDPTEIGVSSTLNSGDELLLNTGDTVELNRKK